jgi:hypothetical protein
MPLCIVFYLFILGIYICSLFNNADNNSNYVASNDWMIVYSELEKTRKGSGHCVNDGGIRTFSWRY